MENFALIFAGGVGARMDTVSLPKQFLEVHGKPIIVHTIEHFQKCNDIGKIVVVCVKEYIQYMVELKEKYNLNKIEVITEGGETCQDSIFRGLTVINKLSTDKDDIVLIHDGVRPVIDVNTIQQNILCVKENGSCVTVSKAIETILTLDGNNIKEVLDRANCYVGKAPQSFYVKDIYQAHIAANEINRHDFIDSAYLMQFFGHKIYTVEGPINNIKVTTPMDFYMFKAMLDSKENQQIRTI